MDRKIVVLDDDPTGTQTVHDVSVYTDWEEDTLLDAFCDPAPMFYVLTNSRSFSEEKTEEVHRAIAGRIAKAAMKTKKDFVLISRGDSTLRGHYPLETEILKVELERLLDIQFDGEIIVPFFPEGGRITAGDIHYVIEGNKRVPVGETEFAKDNTFGYESSNLREYCEEKTKRRYPAEDMISISLKDLRSETPESVYKKIFSVMGFNKIIVNAETYEDLAIFTEAFEKAVNDGKEYIIRGAAAIVKTLGHISDRPLLSRKDLVKEGNKNGGLIVVGSHVQKSTAQLKHLLKCQPEIEAICFDVNSVFDNEKLQDEKERIRNGLEEELINGKNVILYTSRTVIGVENHDKENALNVSTTIADAVAQIVGSLNIRPSYMIAKGGITSSDIGIKALKVKKALVKGQIAPGIPVWETGKESKFPGIPYIIFPGNVGVETTLADIVRKLQ